MDDPSFLFHSYSHPYHQEMAHRSQIWKTRARLWPHKGQVRCSSHTSTPGDDICMNKLTMPMAQHGSSSRMILEKTVSAVARRLSRIAGTVTCRRWLSIGAAAK